VVIGSAGGVLSVSVRSSRSAGPTVVAAMVGLWLCWGSSFPAIRVMVKTHLLVAVIARDDSPEFSAYWTPPVTNFDAEDAPAQIGRVFDSVTVYPWDAPLVTPPDSAAVHDYPDRTAGTGHGRRHGLSWPPRPSARHQARRAHPRHAKPTRHRGRSIEPSRRAPACLRRSIGRCNAPGRPPPGLPDPTRRIRLAIQAAKPAGESTSSEGSNPKPSSWTPGPHSACASSQAVCRRALGAIRSGIPATISTEAHGPKPSRDRSAVHEGILNRHAL